MIPQAGAVCRSANDVQAVEPSHALLREDADPARRSCGVWTGYAESRCRHPSRPRAPLGAIIVTVLLENWYAGSRDGRGQSMTVVIRDGEVDQGSGWIHYTVPACRWWHLAE